MGQEKPRHGRSDRHRRLRSRSAERGRRAQIRKGVGACVFTLGIPLVIAGTIILIVAARGEQGEVPGSFPVVGPILICLAVLFFGVGSVLTEMISIKPCVDYCVPDDPKHCCWTRCPLLFSILRPNDVTLLNRRQAGLNALQSVPSKPVLKKQSENGHAPPVRRGVRFSDSEDTGNARVSISSEHSETSRGDNSPSTSLLSLRHCKIHPKEGERWGSVVSDERVSEVDEEGVDEEGLVFTLSDRVEGDPEVFFSNHVTDHVTDIDQSNDHASPAQHVEEVKHPVSETICEHF